MSNIAPTLLIGVGGRGSDIITRIMDKTHGDNSKRIQCVVLDTDANDLEAIARAYPGLYTIQTSPNMTVAECLGSNDFAREVWFPRNHILESKSLTEGAGQVRAISRLALEQSIVTGKLQPLHDAIADLQLLGTDRFQQGVRVIVAGTIAGGTGSGLFLPLGLYLKNYLTTECNVKGVNIRGFFMLPDILANTVLAGNIDQQKNMRANAYAALRELDAFVARGDGEDLSQYPAVEFDIPVAGSKEREAYPPILPYDHVFLMDYMNADGKTLSSMEDYIDYAADTIYAFAVSPMSQRSNSTEDNEIRRISNVADNGHCRYVGAGAAEICYPLDKVAEYVALQWAQDSIGKEWVLIDRENEIRAERMRRDGAVFDEAREYISNFELKAEDLSKKFFVGLMRQANGQITSDEKAEAKLTDIVLFPSLSAPVPAAAEGEEADSEGEDVVETIAMDDAEYGAIVVKNDVSGNYINALMDEAEAALERHAEYAQMKKVLDDATMMLEYASYDNVEAGSNAYLKTFDVYRTTVQRVAPQVAARISSQLFTLASPEEALQSGGKSSFGYWIRKSGSKNPNDLIHPCAVRYVAYKTLKAFEGLSVDLQGYMDRIDVLIREARRPGGKDIQEKILEVKKEYGDESEGLFAKVLPSSGIDTSAALDDIKARVTRPLLDTAEKARIWARMCLMRAMSAEAIGFFNALNSSYRDFFRYIEMEIPRIKTRIASIEDDKLYNSHTVEKDGRLGNSTRYVCADKNSLSAIMQKTNRVASADELEGEISAQIYCAVLAKAEHDRAAIATDITKPKKATSFSERQKVEAAKREERRAFFRTAYENSILEFWQQKVIDDYANIIDVDIIDAIRNEAAYNGVLTPEDRDHYVKRVLDSAWTLSQIFLQQTVNPNSDRLKACLYDDSIIDVDDNNKMDLLNELNDNGGKAASGVGRNRVLFYQACYGIAVKDLDKFKAPQNIARSDYLARATEDGAEAGGLYYKAYAELIRKLSDNLTQGSYISPHVDSRWHLAFQFPDIDPEEGQRQRYNVIRAFVYALLFGKISSNETASGLRYKKTINGSKTDLTVHDGKCNTFCEIFEALMINNQLVYDLLSDCEARRIEDSSHRSLAASDLTETLMSKVLGYADDVSTPAWKDPKVGSRLEIDSPALPGVCGISNVYDIPLFYEATLTAQDQHGDFIEEMIEAIQDIVFDYVCSFKSKEESYNTSANFFIEQYERYLDTVEMLVGERESIRFLDAVQKLREKVDFWFDQNRGEIIQEISYRWNDVKKREPWRKRASR